MQFFSNFLFGIKAYWKAILFIKEHKLYWFIAFPAVLMIGIYKIGAYFQQRTLAPKVNNMNEIIWFLIHSIFEISIALLLMNFAKYIVVISLSPLFSHLSQKTEHILTGNKYHFKLDQFIKDIRRGIRIALRNLIRQYFFFLLIFLISIIGWEDPKSAPIFYIVFLVSFYYYGFSFIDYVNERRKLSINESVLFVQQHSGLAISIGLIFSLLIFVPVDLSVLFNFSSFQKQGFFFGLGELFFNISLWISASTAPVLAIIASTIAMNDIVGLKKGRS
jgi:CysZ protein